MNQPQVQIFSWLFALIALGGLASAYMSNAHHRYPVLRKKQGDRTRAWLEFFGATLLLLPLCWWMIEMGWVYSHQIQHYPEASPHILRLLAVGNIPIWGLYAVLPFAMVLLACSAISVMLRSMVYLFGPSYLLKRASTHLELSKERQTGPSGRRYRNWGDQIET